MGNNCAYMNKVWSMRVMQMQTLAPIKCKRKEILVWTTLTPMQMQTESSTQGMLSCHFLELTFATYTCDLRQLKRKC